MPIYEYQCVDCSGRDQRVAGLDDHTALCTQCGGLMLRLDEDVFQPYFEEAASPAWPGTDTKTKASL
jgi:putative FmdB family regulatory protein